MPTLIDKVTEIKACGDISKVIQEVIGRVNSDTNEVSIAHMKSPAGWSEPGQTPEFNEYTYVLEGVLHVKTKEAEFDVAAGQGIIAQKGEWVQYSTPDLNGAQYIAVCSPAFSPDTVHRDKK